jgi:hypothetical protein
MKCPVVVPFQIHSYGLPTWLLLVCSLVFSVRSFASPCGPCERVSIMNTGSQTQGTDELPSLVMSLSKADMELSKAEASVGRLEALWIKWVKITIILLLIPIFYGIILIILSFREE